MANIKVKGVADFSAINAEVNNLHQAMNKVFGQDGQKIIDDESVVFLQKSAETAFVKMGNQLEKLKKEGRQLADEMKKVTGDEKKSEELSRKRAENVKKIVMAEKGLLNLKKGQSDLNLGMPQEQLAKILSMEEKKKKAADKAKAKAAKDKQNEDALNAKKSQLQNNRQNHVITGAASGGLTGIVNQLPGGSAITAVGGSAVNAGQAASAAGLGAGAVVGLSVLAAAAAAAAVAISRMVSGFDVYLQQVPKILNISSMGVKPLTDGKTISRAAELGYKQSDVLDVQQQMEHSFGRAQNQQQDSNRMVNVLTGARALGMSPQEITGGGDQLRKVGGTDMAQKQMAMILEKAITSGMDKTQTSAYLSSAVELLASINSGGTSNTNQLLSVMTDLVSKGHMSPEQASKSIGGLNSAIAGSSGESNAFFQLAAARQGLGGGTLLGSQFAVRQGLAGVDMGALGNQVGDTKSGRMGMKAIGEMGLGDANFSQKFAGSILNEINGRFNQNSKEGRQASLGFVGQMFGSKSAPEAVKTLALLEKIAKGTGNDKDKKMLQELTKDPAEAWRDKSLEDLDKTALATAASQAALEKGQFELGETSAQYINTLNDSLVILDGTINNFLKSDAFSSIKDALGDLGNSFKSIFVDGLDDLKKVPEALKGLFNSIMSDPAEFGRTLGKGFMDVALSLIDKMKAALQPIIDTFTSFISDPKKALGSVGDSLGSAYDSFNEGVAGVGHFIRGVGQGASEASDEKASTGSVSYTPDQAKILDNVKDVAVGATAFSTPAMIARGFSGSGMGSSSSTPTSAPGASASDSTTSADAQVGVNDMVNEQKKTNNLLEKVLRPTSAPRTGRDSSRP